MNTWLLCSFEFCFVAALESRPRGMKAWIGDGHVVAALQRDYFSSPRMPIWLQGIIRPAERDLPGPQCL